MDPIKFVKFDDPMVGPVIVLFPACLQHRDVARQIGHTVLSAGFVRPTPEGWETYGESLSLGIAADPSGDAIVLKLQYPQFFPDP